MLAGEQIRQLAGAEAMHERTHWAGAALDFRPSLGGAEGGVAADAFVGPCASPRLERVDASEQMRG